MLPELVLREEWRDAPADDGTAAARAAAAVSRGEPKRALALLSGQAGPVAAAIGHAARVLDVNWFPGGAGAVGFENVDLSGLAMPPDAAAATPETSLPAYLFARVTAQLPGYRSIVAGARRADVDLGAPILAEAQATAQRVLATDEPHAIGPVAYMLAELLVLAGHRTAADGPLGVARQMYQAVGDPVGEAACRLAEGDWAAHPHLTPDLLGEDLEPRSAGGSAAVLDAVAAEHHYAAAEELYAAAGGRRGAAAVAVRRSRLALAANDPDTALSLLTRAGEHAEAAGDGALRMLVVVHRALATIQAGGQVAADAIGEQVAGWAGGPGSSSYARGLARLCYAKAQRWRGGDVLRGHRALLVAEAIGTRVGATAEAAMFDRERAELYVGANYRRAAFVWTMVGLAEVRGSGADMSPLHWAGHADRVLRAHRDANALADPAAVRRVHEELVRLRARTPAGLPAPADQIPPMVDASLAEAAVLVPLYEGVQARAAGDADRAAARFAAALDVAQQLGAVMLQVVVLGTMHRRDDAAALIQPYLGGLPPDIAVTLLVRLHRYHEALALIEQHAPTGPERPWEPAARHAEALLGVGRPEPAAELAGEAIGHFERHLGQLSRDILRVTAGDDVTVAGLYGIAVRAHAALAVDAPAAEHTARAFEYSDRARGTSLADLIDLGGTADPGVAAAVRDWHRAGAVLARTIEEVARSTDPPRQIRAMVAGAERELDAAEARLAEVAPALSGRRPLPVTPSLDRIQSWLAPGALLLHFYAYDDELIGIAVTRDTARPVRLAAPTPQLTAAVRRFHGAVSDRTSSAARRTERGQPLADLLLEPFAAELGDVERVIVVPHGNLAMLPFGVLPFGGDVLAASHQVSYLPAASLLDPRRDDDATTFDMAAPTLVVGNPAYGRERGMPPLPGAEVEAVTVARLRKQEALRGPAADRAAVLGGLPAARIVHLATHGLLIEGAPYSAELALAGADSLTIPDLAGVGAAVDLAVLSACDSGRGRATSAGDVVGLTRAFLSAGVRQLVTSLWPVDDRLACLTMVGFHRELLGGRPPAAALSAAQREVRGLTAAEVDERYGDLVAGAGRDPAAEDPSRTRDIRPRHDQPPVQGVDHPFFWAPFIHVGR